MQTKATSLVEENGEVAGLRAQTPDGEIEIRAALVIGADGRHSTIREQAGFVPRESGSAIDVIWFRLPRRSSDPTEPVARIGAGRFLVMLYRGDYWQCAFVVPKGGFWRIRQQGLEAFRYRLGLTAGFAADRIDAIRSFDDMSLLTVTVDRLPQWAKPGVLCIGDAAHAMSPVGGVGINIAVQDAVATANLLWRPLRQGRPSFVDLKKVQGCREFPAKLTQAAQVLIQDRIVAPTLQSTGELKVPWALKLLQRFPVLRRIPARLVGMGVRPEHVSPELLRRT
jgi:2-polyprenyl-6-methoxyphenol hydroxylase-like FAD-dependent oxidoreductase